MTVGLASANYAGKVLNHMHTATASTAPASNNIQVHTADPGAAGTTSVAADNRRFAATFGAAAAVSTTMTSTMSNTPSWTVWTGGSVTVSHISGWDSVTAGAGNFLYSAALTTSKAITNGDTFTLSSLTVALSPIAA